MVPGPRAVLRSGEVARARRSTRSSSSSPLLTTSTVAPAGSVSATISRMRCAGLVGGVGPALVRLPGFAPLLLEAALVRLQQLVVLAASARACRTRPRRSGGRTRPRRRRAGSRLVRAQGVVVVLEQADLEPLVERADPLEGVARIARQNIVGRGCRTPPRVPRARRAAANSSSSPQVSVGGVDLGLVADAVRDRADEPHRRVSRAAHEPRQPARRDDRVVVEQHQQVAPRHRETLVAGRARSRG